MKILQSIEPYKSFYFKASVTPKSPISGFSIAFGTTGEVGDFSTGVVFSGRKGLVFDQNGNFFGGYYNSRQIDIEGHLFNNRLSYFYNGTLISNNIQINNNYQLSDAFNCFEFDKIEDSTVFVEVNYISGYKPIGLEEGLKDNNGIFLISSDNYYILPKI